MLYAAAITLLVAGPWLGGGFLFGTDWPGPRRIAFPTELSGAAPATALVAAISWVASGELAGKIVWVGALFFAALGAYRAVPAEGFVARVAGATVFVANPFVYGRLHYGQLFLVAAYAALPWMAIRLRKFVADPGLRTSVVLAVSVGVIGAFSLHLVMLAGVLAVAQGLAHLVAARERVAYVRRLAPAVLAAAGATLLVSAYWVVPLLAGRSPDAMLIARTSSADLTAFAAVADRGLGLLPNLLGLYGFWAENAGRFTSMKSFVPFWPAVLGVLLGVALVGAVSAFAQRHHDLAPWVTGLLIAGATALALEMGVSHPATAGFVEWLDAHVSLYRGMRDAGKWGALVALVYSQLFSLGVAALLSSLSKVRLGRVGREWVVGAATGLLIALPLYYGNGLLFGMHGEIKPSAYPAGWFAADRLLASDPHPGRSLFLPWHLYMRYSFIQNQNRVIACPAQAFFSIPIVSSVDPEVPGVAPPATADQAAISSLVAGGVGADWAPVLSSLGIRYVVVAHELDWASYDYLARVPGLVQIADFGSIVVYQLRSGA